MTPAESASPNTTPQRGSAAKILLGCAAAVLFVVVLGLVGMLVGWHSFLRYGISTDLSKYYATISAADLPAETKDPVLKKIDEVREVARRSPMGLFKWFDYDASIDGVLKDGPITPQDLDAVMKELDRMEKEMGGK